MRIALLSHCFYPSIGGIETMTETLAEGFRRAGHEVIVVTQTECKASTRSFEFEVVRRPHALRLLRIARWCDVYFQNNISLNTIWPLALIRRPLIIRHATWIERTEGARSWRVDLKRFLLRYAICISNSRAIASSMPAPSTVIGNPYQDQLFVENPAIDKDRDLVFLGRLVTDKGPHLLLDALDQLRDAGLFPTVTFVGAGDQLASLRDRVNGMGLGHAVEFVGPKRGTELVHLLNRHRIMVVPSIWKEPFGIVALEGAASGCVVVGSSGGGLSDAIGPCGPTFPNGDGTALAETLQRLLEYPDELRAYRAAASAHLHRHTADYVTAKYLQVISGAVRSP